MRAAVLTGDLVASSKAGAQAIDHAMQDLERAAQKISKFAGGNACFTRSRGDGWQALIHNPAYALRAVFLLLAELRAGDSGLSTRLAVAIGDVAQYGGTDLSDAAGPAFEHSGRALEKIKRNRRLIAGGDCAEMAMLLPLTETLTRSWTRAQAEAISLALLPDAPVQTELASQLGITQQSLGERLDLAGFNQIQDTLSQLEPH